MGREVAFWVGNNERVVGIANKVSVGQVYTETKMPIKEWLRCLLSEHSTLEFSDFFLLATTDGRTLSHLVRHTKGHPRHVVQSQREDWTKQARPAPETPRKYISKWNPYSWIQMMRQRLCKSAAKHTHDFAILCKKELEASSIDFLRGVGWASVPECVYRCGCPYGARSCGAWKATYKSMCAQCDSIEERYDAYSEFIHRQG